MEVDQILSRIREEWQREMDNSSLIRDLMNKISQGKATYADAQDVAIKAGDALSDLFRRYLPEALVDGRLPEEIADKLIRQPLMDTYKLASSQAADVQRSLNQAADIGIDAVVPDPNVDQIDGIIHGISTARDYHHYEESFLDQVENFPEGVVDDTVRANADFQYHAGLFPTIERKTDGKCCPWCSRLAGTYPYEDVRNAGNDVFRRHRNCHCQVLFNPGDGSKRRQNVHSRQWTDIEKTDRMMGLVHPATPIERQSGASSGAKKTKGWEDRHAIRYYEEVRKRAPYVDADKIAQHVTGFSRDELEDIRQHMFIREIPRDGTLKRFDPDYDQAEAWQRLVQGTNIWESDIVMLQHERMELTIMQTTGCGYEEAHNQTQMVHDWWNAYTKEKARREK